MHFLYNLFIKIYYLSAVVVSFFNKKTQKWVEGRKGLMEQIAFEIDQEEQHVWFHCASLGEFEQGRPVIERFGKDNPEYKIVLTFFSPSGYEVRKDYPGVDHVFYLPLDTPLNVRRFIEYVYPKMAIFVKYEYWFNFLHTLHDYKIPVVYVSAILGKKDFFSKWWAKWFRNELKKVTYFFLQNKESADYLYSMNIRNAIVSGDTRFDRVSAIRQSPPSFPKVEKFVQGSLIYIAGSTWPEDDRLLIELINKKYNDIKFIIAPHEIDQENMNKIIFAAQGKVVKYSEYDEQKFKDAQVLIIDRIGMLSGLYQYASVAYIGGGFGNGIHNTLEAATFGMPVLFGPNYQKFGEAKDLIRLGAAFPVKSQKELIDVSYKLLSDYTLLSKCSKISMNYVEQKKGATDTIMLFLNAMINPGKYHTTQIDNYMMN